MNKFNPGDVVYNIENPMYMYLVLSDGNDGIVFTSFQEQVYDGTAEGLSTELEGCKMPINFYPRLSKATVEKEEENFVFLTNISNVLVHLEIELQKLREEREYEEIPF